MSFVRFFWQQVCEVLPPVLTVERVAVLFGEVFFITEFIEYGVRDFSDGEFIASF